MRIPTTTAITIAILASACSGGGDGPEQPAEDAAVTGDSSGPSSDASVARDAARAEAGTPSCVPACGPKQICVAGSCKDLPSQCPCPIESYCDLTTNQCVPGCMSDADCQQGRYCDAARTCRDGCRVGSCPANEVCSLSTRICECTSGYHRCAGSCVKEGIASCGPACEVCPTDPFGTASCAASGCQLACKNGYKMCAGSCAACPTDKASSFACSGKSCVAAQCSTGHHVCSGSCVLEDVKSCGASCAACKDATQGACSSGACYGVVDFGYYPSATTCAARCASQGKSCGEVCDIQYTRPNGGQYHQVAGGHYTQQAAYEPWGFLKCSDTPPGGAPTSIRCCCTEQLTGTPKPGCTKHSDCKASEFCWAAKQECYATTNSSCPPGYTYKGQCSNGTQFCAHSGLPAGTTFPFETACPAGTTQRGGFYCSGETRVCVPD